MLFLKQIGWLTTRTGFSVFLTCYI